MFKGRTAGEDTKMLHRKSVKRPEYVYPVDEWRLVEASFYPRFLARSEAFFSTSNGYFGMRGSFEEGKPVHHTGTFVNGFYEAWPIVYGEAAYGFAKTGQTIVDVPDAKIVKLYVDDEPFFLPTANLLEFERALDMRTGTLDRRILWQTPSGKVVSIRSQRLVSLQHRHIGAISYEVTLLNDEAPVVLSSQLSNQGAQVDDAGSDPRLPHEIGGRALLPRGSCACERRIVLGHATRNSGMSIASAVDHVLETECEHLHETMCTENLGKVVFSIDARPGVPIHLVKYITYHTSRSTEPEELCDRANRSLDRTVRRGYEALCAGQKERVDEFWRRADVRVAGDPAAQQAIRFNLFHILQASARAEGAGIPSKGLTGKGYEGHYFWDTEIYVLPFLIYSSPFIARNLLKFRCSLIEEARKRARELNQKGALFPWRTINGQEASAYYAAGTAQYHINADIIYALKKYVEATGDEEFLLDVGAEMLVETARMWRDLGFYSDRKGGRFCIAGVTGPDEYNTVVNNNTFTNLMARENLRYAAETVRNLRDQRPRRFAALVDRTGLEEPEIEEWQRAADRMYVPYDEDIGIHPQDDDFLDKKPWDFESAASDKYPLLLHYHPLDIYRHQVIKQADVVLAMFLLGDEFSAEQKRRNFDYYDPLTTGDSSLSVSVQSIVAFEIGYPETAREYGRYALLMDLADIGGNVKDGCHIASMGGTWMALVYGIAGFRDYGGRFSFRPKIPPQLDSVSFSLTIRNHLLDVEVASDCVTYTLREGRELSFHHEDQEVTLSPDKPVSRHPRMAREADRVELKRFA